MESPDSGALLDIAAKKQRKRPVNGKFYRARHRWEAANGLQLVRRVAPER
jgi:hypothetical protein